VGGGEDRGIIAAGCVGGAAGVVLAARVVTQKIYCPPTLWREVTKKVVTVRAGGGAGSSLGMFVGCAEEPLNTEGDVGEMRWRQREAGASTWGYYSVQERVRQAQQLPATGVFAMRVGSLRSAVQVTAKRVRERVR